MAVVPFRRHQFPVLAQKRIRRHQCLELVQHPAPERLRFSGEAASLGIGEANAPAAQPHLQHAVFFLQILDHVQLMTVDPTSEHHQQEVKGCHQGGHCR